MIRAGPKAGFAALAAALVLAGCIGAGSNSKIKAAKENHFPSMTGIDLTGGEIAVPAGLGGERKLVVTGYVREHQNDIDTWIAKVPELKRREPRLVFYELPVIGSRSALSRFWINNGMRSGIPGDERRRAVVTVYTDTDRFRSLLDLASLAEIHVFLLDGEGRVLARTTGRYSERAARALLDGS